MSTGDQIIGIIVNSLGTVLTSLIGAFFTAFVTPSLAAVAAIFGL